MSGHRALLTTLAASCIDDPFNAACRQYGVRLRRNMTNQVQYGKAVTYDGENVTEAAGMKLEACGDGTNISVPLCAICKLPQYYRNTSTGLCTKCEVNASQNTAAQVRT